MTTIETIATIENDGLLHIVLPIKIVPGKHKIVVVIEEEVTEEEEELTESEKEFFRKELKEMRENPNGGSTWEDVISEMEVRLGRKIQVPGR